MQKRYNWSEIQAYYDDRHTIKETRARFGFNLASWAKAAKRGDVKSRKRGHLPRPELYAHNRYDWAEVQRYYDDDHTRAETTRHFGFQPDSWDKAVARGDLFTRGRTVTVDYVLRRYKSRQAIKRRLIELGILENRCDGCGITEWRGMPLSIQIDHINGIRDDYRLENLRMLCPNCHSQTETFGARNKVRLKAKKSVVTDNPGWCNGSTPDSDSGNCGSNP